MFFYVFTVTRRIGKMKLKITAAVPLLSNCCHLSEKIFIHVYIKNSLLVGPDLLGSCLLVGARRDSGHLVTCTINRLDNAFSFSE